MSVVESPIIANKYREVKDAKVFFFLLSVCNFALFIPNVELLSFIVGELIIALYILDLLKTSFRFHVYQILLLYFYYSLCITNAFSDFSSIGRYAELGSYYAYGYFVNIVYFVFFVMGYHLIGYEHGFYVTKNRQNKAVVMFFIYSIILALLAIFSVEYTSTGYSDHFTKSSQQARMTMFSAINLIVSSFYEYIKYMFLFLLSNPFVYSVYNLISGVAGYVLSGIKGGVVAPVMAFIFLYQVYYRKITIRSLMFFFPIILIGVIFLIGTTSFRGDLSLNSLLSLSYYNMESFLTYFLVSPESSHIVYTADIIKMIDQSVIDFRYGFDYIKFILFPFKALFDFFGFSSFVEYTHVSTGSKISQGLYLGMAGELYWNFGPLFVFPAFLLGISLKKFTNWAFSLSMLGIIAYVILGKAILWIYYRGIANELMIFSTLYLIALLFFVFIIKSYRYVTASSEYRQVKTNII